MLAMFSEILACHNDQQNLKKKHIFINTERIFMFMCLFRLFFMRNMTEVIMPC